MNAPIDNILVNGRFLTRTPTGVDRFAIQLMNALARRREPQRADIAVPSDTRLRDPDFASLHRVIGKGRRRGQAWEQLELPGLASGRPLVNLCNAAPLWRERQLVVIHDLGTVANASNYGRAFRYWYRLMHGAVMKRSRVVATVSYFSADELTRHHGRRRHGIEVIHESGEHVRDHMADQTIIDRLGLTAKRYVLAVGSLSVNKNFRSVLQAVQMVDDPDLLVVAVGGGDPRVFAQANFEDARLRMTGYVSDAELRALYENAMCFAFPSFYEGFGLPPLEAMCCGCPVIVSDRASLPEVCGNAALYCKAEDPATLAFALKRLLESPAQRRELSEAGRLRSANFTWAKAASHFEQVVNASFA